MKRYLEEIKFRGFRGFLNKSAKISSREKSKSRNFEKKKNLRNLVAAKFSYGNTRFLL